MDRPETVNSVRQTVLGIGVIVSIVTGWFLIVDPLVRGVVGELVYPYNYLAVLGVSWLLIGIAYALSEVTDDGRNGGGGLPAEEETSSTGGVS